MRRTNLNIRLADQNPACRGRPHERNTQLTITAFEQLRYQLTTDFDGLGATEKHRFCYQLWAKATGTKPPKRNRINPANAEISGG